MGNRIYNLPEDFDFNSENTDRLTRSPYFTGIRKYMNISARSTYSHRFSSKWNAQFGASYTTMLFDVKLREVNFSLPNVSYKLEF